VASTDTVLDAIRIGQEALQKATHLQFSGNGILSRSLIAFGIGLSFTGS
jgi:hypothetical protein